MSSLRSVVKNPNLIRVALIDFIFLMFILVWYKREFDLLLMLTVIFLSCLIVIMNENYTRILFFTVAFPVIEVICIFFGVWQYSVTSILNIPLWLFPAWGQAVFTVIYFHKEIQEEED